jgi:hypothetical protein
MAIPDNQLYILEWFTYDHIPFRRHALLVDCEMAAKYQKHPKVSVHKVYSELYDETRQTTPSRRRSDS